MSDPRGPLSAHIEGPTLFMKHLDSTIAGALRMRLQP
jgi:hypothetical protein